MCNRVVFRSVGECIHRYPVCGYRCCIQGTGNNCNDLVSVAEEGIGMKRWIVILVIFCLSVPLVFASAPTWNKETEPTVKVVYEGGTAITDSLSTKSHRQP